MTAPHNFTNTASPATLAGSLSTSAFEAALDVFANFPAPPFTATIDRDKPTEEVVLVTDVLGTTATLQRGYDGTAAQAHSAGASFEHTAIAKHFRDAAAHTAATTGVHGLASAPVGVSDAQTLTNKTLTTPTITSPTITGTADMVDADVSGSLAVGGALAVGGDTTLAGNLAVTGPLTVDGLDVNTRLAAAEATLTAATASPTPSTLVQRDANGDAAVDKLTLTDAPTAAGHAARKDYVDSKIAALRQMYVSATAPTGTIPEGAVWFQVI